MYCFREDPVKKIKDSIEEEIAHLSHMVLFVMGMKSLKLINMIFAMPMQ